MAHRDPSSPFVLSIETSSGVSEQHPFHLGTDERLARQIAVEKYNARVANGLPVVTVALMRDGRMVDCYVGDRWASEYTVEEVYGDDPLGDHHGRNM